VDFTAADGEQARTDREQARTDGEQTETDREQTGTDREQTEEAGPDGGAGSVPATPAAHSASAG
jgi:hypothetical protein